MARYGMQRSPEMARAIETLRAGKTRSQRDQAFLEKAIMTGAQAGLTFTAGAFKAGESERLQAEQVRKDKAEKVAGALKSAPLPPPSPPVVDPNQDEYGMQRTLGTPHAPAGPDRSAMMNNAVMNGAERAVANQKLNSSANMTTLDGYDTPEGLRKKDNGAGQISRDIGTAQSLMSEGNQMDGGMLQSLRKAPR